MARGHSFLLVTRVRRVYKAHKTVVHGICVCWYIVYIGESEKGRGINYEKIVFRPRKKLHSDTQTKGRESGA